MGKSNAQTVDATADTVKTEAPARRRGNRTVQQVATDQQKQAEQTPPSMVPKASASVANVPTGSDGNVVAAYSVQDASEFVLANLAMARKATLLFVASCVTYLYGACYGSKPVKKVDAMAQIDKWIAELQVRKSHEYALRQAADKLSSKLLETEKLGGIVAIILNSKTAQDATLSLSRWLETEHKVSSLATLKHYLSPGSVWTDEKAIKAAERDAKRKADKEYADTPAGKAAITRQVNKAKVDAIASSPALLGPVMVRVLKSDSDGFMKEFASAVESIGSADILESMAQLIADKLAVVKAMPQPEAIAPATVATKETQH